MKGNFPKVIILLVVVFLAYKSLSRGIKSFTSRPAAGVSTEQVPADTALEDLLPTKQANNTSPATESKPDVLAALSGYGRTPFISAEESKTTTPEAATSSRTTAYEPPQLTTILNYEGKWFAIVNGNLVKAGDKIGKMKILEIKENLVNIEEAGRIYKLKLWQEAILK